IGSGASPGVDNGVGTGIPPPTSAGGGAAAEVPRRKCNIVGKRVINVPGSYSNNPSEYLATESDPLAVNQDEDDDDEDEVDDKDGEQGEKGDGGDFVTLNNRRKGGSHKQKKHHSKHAHKKGGRKWAGKCVAKGSFCDGSLFGCRFDSKAMYLCDGVGAASQPFMHCGTSACSTGLVFGADVCETETPETAPPTVPLTIPPVTKTLPPTGGPTDPGVKTGVPNTTPASNPQPGTTTTTNNPATGDPVPPKTKPTTKTAPPLTELSKNHDPTPYCYHPGIPLGGSVAETCKCPGKWFYCGAGLLEIDVSCGTDKNYVYGCTAGAGTNPVTANLCEPGKKQCTSDAIKGAICKDIADEGCQCPSAGIFCAEELYFELCKDVIGKNDPQQGYVCYYPGVAAVPFKQCQEGYKCQPKSASELSTQASYSYEFACVGNTPPGGSPANFDCADAGHASFICGVTFDRGCDYSRVSLYKCEKKGAKSELAKYCQQGCEKGSHVCTSGGDVAEDCKCTGAGIYCSGELDHFCKANKDYIYDCTAGPGTKLKHIAYCLLGKEECVRRDTGGKPRCPPGMDACDLHANDCRELIDKNGLRAIYTWGDTQDAMYELLENCPKNFVCQRKSIAMESVCGLESMNGPGIDCVEEATTPGSGSTPDCHCKDTGDILTLLFRP
ncbi:hypothetical protein BGW39_001248, partial [Mortierella sp. 14UC]